MNVLFSKKKNIVNAIFKFPELVSLKILLKCVSVNVTKKIYLNIKLHQVT